jgi:cytochrome c oxidase subunit 2
LSAVCGGCTGPQSALRGLGVESERVATLFWTMLFGSAAIMGLVFLSIVLALFGGPAVKRFISEERTVIAAGIALPVVVLSTLLIYGFLLLAAESDDPEGADPLRIAVQGEQWWWRVTYLHPDGAVTESANEIRIPVGRPVVLELTTADVIHSFWVPPLAGKVDMIPGHVNRLSLTATSPGVTRGQCAEYCGGPHALMSLYVVADGADSFADWLDNERSEARADDIGSALFQDSGCGGCHAIRGTGASGTIGPDLTHVGARISLGAGLLRTAPAAFDRWIRLHFELKPENRMPPFEFLSDSDVQRLAAYLASLD